MIARTGFPLADALVLILYLLAMALAGLYFSRRNVTTEDYFLGGRSFPHWALGISMIGTSISSITFLGMPAAAFLLDWRQLVPNFMLPVAVVVAIFVFIPFFRRANVTSAFEYLEARFGPLIRLYGSLGFILLQLVRLGTILYLASLPISLLTGFSTPWVIVIGGIALSFYTVIGGMRAVVWTDVVQFVVLAAGGLVCFLYIVTAIPGGIGQVFQVGMEHHKFNLGDMHWDSAQRTFWMMALIGLFNFLNEYSGNQNVIQRYAAAASMRDARKAAAMCGAISVPIWAFFFLLGTALFVFYQQFQDPAVAQLRSDEVLPHFILTHIPPGVVGLIIAGILGAAMSTLDSAINAIATVVTVDIVKRYVARDRHDALYLRTAWVVSTAAAVLMIVGALFVDHIAASGRVENVVDLGFIVASIFGGCLMGLFMVGFFTWRVGYGSAMVALAVGIVLNVYLVLCTFGKLPPRFSVQIHEYLVGIVANIAFIGLACLLGLIRPARRSDSVGLTVWTITRDHAVPLGGYPKGEVVKSAS